MGGLFLCFGVLLGVFLLFFPIYLELDLHYQSVDKKVGISLYLFKFIKVIGGYLDTYPGGFVLHTKPNKAILLPISDKEGQKKRVSIFRRFRLSDFAVTTETGADYLPLVVLLNGIFKGYYLWQGGDLDSYQSHIWLKNGDVFSLTLNAVAKLNLYMQICAFIKGIKEKIYAKRK